MTKPTIHLNGTSRISLAEAYIAALTAVGNAIEAVQATGPNGRDYYPQGAGAMESALAEHGARLARLDTVHAELMALILHCQGGAS